MDGTVEELNGDVSEKLASKLSSIEYNTGRDLPLMSTIRNAGFISHGQLWEEMETTKVERSRRSFNWRLQRLVETDLVRKLPPKIPYKGAVYTITRLGLECLEACGNGLMSLSSNSRCLMNPNQMQHYLELSEIRRALVKSGTLREWTGDMELRSINCSIDTPLAKDYDAIAEIQWNGAIHRLAIEYERNLKSAERYRDLSTALKGEDQVKLLLYLTPSVDMLYQLVGYFRDATIHIAAALSRQFCANPMGCRLHLTGISGTKRTTLAELLKQDHGPTRGKSTRQSTI